jgi:hypothetical protein
MKTFMDFLSEATMDMVHPPEVADSHASPLHAAMDSAFPSGKVRGSGKFIVSGTKNLRGQKASSAIAIIQNGHHARWQDIKRAVDAQVALFPAFEQDEIRRGKMPFVNTDDPIVDVGEGGNMNLTWYRPYNSVGSHSQWGVPQVSSDNLKQTG